MSSGAKLVVEHFNEIVKPDGGEVEMLSVENDVLSIAYRPGVNEECETCVIRAEDLADMIKEALRQHDPSISEIRVETP